MTDFEVTHRAVLDDPNDDLARLAFADACAEAGDEARAEFVRVEVELAAWNRECFCHIFESKPGNPVPQCANCFDRETLRCRERKLLEANIGDWADGLPDALITVECSRCRDSAADWETGVVECRWCECTGVVQNYDSVDFRRGFINEIALTLEQFTEDAARRLFAAHPIARVRLVGRMPSRFTYGDREWVWYEHTSDTSAADVQANPHWLPQAIHSQLIDGWKSKYGRRYKSREAAELDLERGAANWGRSMVGLPRLEA